MATSCRGIRLISFALCFCVCTLGILGEGPVTAAAPSPQSPAAGVGAPGARTAVPPPGLRFRLMDGLTDKPYESVNQLVSVTAKVDNGTTVFTAYPGRSKETGVFVVDSLSASLQPFSRIKALILKIDGYTFPLTDLGAIRPSEGPKAVVDLGDILIRSALIFQGVLVNAKTGEPISDAAPVACGYAAGTVLKGDGAFKWLATPGAFEARIPKGDAPPTRLRLGHPAFVPRDLSEFPAADNSGRRDLGRIALEPGIHWEGLLVNEDGKPVGGVGVSLSGQLGSSLTTRRAKSGADGALAFDGLWPQTFSVMLGNGFPPSGVADNVVVTVGPSAGPNRMVVHPNSVLRGRVVDLLGRPLAGWTATVHAADSEPQRGDPAEPKAITSGIGEFELALPTGSLRLHVSGGEGGHDDDYSGDTASYVCESAPVVVTPGVQVFTVPIADRLEARVVARGGTLPGWVKASLSVKGPKNSPEPEGGMLALQSASVTRSCRVTDGRLHIAFPPLVDGTITVSGTGIPETKVDYHVPTQNGDTFDIGDVGVLAGGPVTVRLIYKQTQQPFGHRGVEGMFHGVKDDGSEVPLHDSTVGIPDGVFSFATVPPGTKAIAVTGQDFARLEIPIDLDAKHELGTFFLDPGITYRASLVSARDNQPLRGLSWADMALQGWRQGDDNDRPSASVKSFPGAVPGDVYSNGDKRWLYLPAGLAQVAIEAKGFETHRIESPPAPDAEGIVQLGKISLKPLATPTPVVSPAAPSHPSPASRATASVLRPRQPKRTTADAIEENGPLVKKIGACLLALLAVGYLISTVLRRK